MDQVLLYNYPTYLPSSADELIVSLILNATALVLSVSTVLAVFRDRKLLAKYFLVLGVMLEEFVSTLGMIIWAADGIVSYANKSNMLLVQQKMCLAKLFPLIFKFSDFCFLSLFVLIPLHYCCNLHLQAYRKLYLRQQAVVYLYCTAIVLSVCTSLCHALRLHLSSYHVDGSCLIASSKEYRYVLVNMSFSISSIVASYVLQLCIRYSTRKPGFTASGEQPVIVHNIVDKKIRTKARLMTKWLLGVDVLVAVFHLCPICFKISYFLTCFTPPDTLHCILQILGYLSSIRIACFTMSLLLIEECRKKLHDSLIYCRSFCHGVA